MFRILLVPRRLGNSAFPVQYKLKPQFKLLGNQTRTVKTSTVDWKPISTEKTPLDALKNPHRWGKRILLTLMIAMPVVSFYLGTWQLRRLKWKKDLIATFEDRLVSPAILMPKKFSSDMCKDWEYRKVIVKGKYLHQEEIFVGPKKRNGILGYDLFTPFIRSDTGERILIERGWISKDKVVPESRKLQRLSLPSGNNVKVTCLVRVPKGRGTFQREKTNKESRLWQIADMPELIASTNTLPVHLQALYDLKDHYWESTESVQDAVSKANPWWRFWSVNKVKIFFEKHNDKTDHELTDMEFNEFQFVAAGVPIGIQPEVALRNNHLQYLVTWYGLSLFSTFFLISSLKRNSTSAVSHLQRKMETLQHYKKYS